MKIVSFSNPSVKRQAVNGREFIEELMGYGRYTFTNEDAEQRMGGTRSAALAAVRRLRDNHSVISPVRGFWVIVPPEYRSLGCLPAEQFVPELMQFMNLPYYVGLLTSAAYHGAAHQRPQAFQVMTTRPRRQIERGRVQVEFVVRADAAELPVVKRNTQTGVIRVSTPEATALDIVGYQDRCAGLENVATILAELGNLLNPEELVHVASGHGPQSWAQRLGYLLDLVGHDEVTGPLSEWVAASVNRVTPLLHAEQATTGAPRNLRWQIAVNVELEPDL